MYAKGYSWLTGGEAASIQDFLRAASRLPLRLILYHEHARRSERPCPEP